MLRYRLDDLGWYQFEAMIQSLLKADIALGIESWGGSHGDHGRDAYFDGPLPFPTNAARPGPFLFQVKFVIGANAAGAKPFENLAKAIAKEIGRIKRRDPDEWSNIRHYTLITNSPLEVEWRTKLAATIKSVLPDAVHRSNIGRQQLIGDEDVRAGKLRPNCNADGHASTVILMLAGSTPR
ncbi:hypothetical protein HY522_02370 [bacterium]|nr:hypothetical protein [bacterium]